MLLLTFGKIQRKCDNVKVNVDETVGLQLSHELKEPSVFVHIPLQECGEVLIRSISNGIQRCDGKRICAC